MPQGGCLLNPPFWQQTGLLLCAGGGLGGEPAPLKQLRRRSPRSRSARGLVYPEKRKAMKAMGGGGKPRQTPEGSRSAVVLDGAWCPRVSPVWSLPRAGCSRPAKRGSGSPPRSPRGTGSWDDPPAGESCQPPRAQPGKAEPRRAEGGGLVGLAANTLRHPAPCARIPALSCREGFLLPSPRSSLLLELVSC